MDFLPAVIATTPVERDDLIRTHIEGNCDEFQEMLDGDYMRHGGFPDDVCVDKVTIFDDLSGTLIVTVDITFTESVASSCKDYNHAHPGNAEFRLRINKVTGKHEVEEPEVDIGWPGDDDDEFDIEVHEDDYR